MTAGLTWQPEIGPERVGEREQHEPEGERGGDDARGDARPRELEAERQRRGPHREDDEECGAEELGNQTTTERCFQCDPPGRAVRSAEYRTERAISRRNVGAARRSGRGRGRRSSWSCAEAWSRRRRRRSSRSIASCSAGRSAPVRARVDATVFGAVVGGVLVEAGIVVVDVEVVVVAGGRARGRGGGRRSSSAGPSSRLGASRRRLPGLLAHELQRPRTPGRSGEHERPGTQPREADERGAAGPREPRALLPAGPRHRKLIDEWAADLTGRSGARPPSVGRDGVGRPPAPPRDE